jgi:hypothetical protein
MTTTTSTKYRVRGVHLNGGLAVPDVATAMRLQAEILGDHLYAVIDGEPNERNQWIMWLATKLFALDGIEVVGQTGEPRSGIDPVYAGFPILAVADTVTEIPVPGYAAAARESYRIYKRLQEDGVLAGDVKFQVALPTPYAPTVCFVRPEDQERFLVLYERVIEDEITAIADLVPADELVIQFDTAIEIGAIFGVFEATDALSKKQAIIDALNRALRMPPAGVERGLHFCYGDLRHRHFKAPTDLGLCVELGNGVTDLADFVSMPADRNNGRWEAYYEPVRDLKVRRLALGVIDYRGDELTTTRAIQAAQAGVGPSVEFAVSTECGMARIHEIDGSGPSLEDLLRLHAQSAAPIR